MRYLSKEYPDWTEEDWAEWREERAAIFEYEAGLPREVAEAKALELAEDAIDRLRAPAGRQEELFPLDPGEEQQRRIRERIARMAEL